MGTNQLQPQHPVTHSIVLPGETIVLEDPANVPHPFYWLCWIPDPFRDPYTLHVGRPRRSQERYHLDDGMHLMCGAGSVPSFFGEPFVDNREAFGYNHIGTLPAHNPAPGTTVPAFIDWTRISEFGDNSGQDPDTWDTGAAPKAAVST